MKQTIEIEVPRGFIVAWQEKTFPDTKSPQEAVLVYFEKAPYYDDLQELLADGYEDIGTNEATEEGDLWVDTNTILPVNGASLGTIPRHWPVIPLAILRKRLTGAAWLKAQKNGVVFIHKDIKYVVWYGYAISERNVPVIFGHGDWQKDCSDETCRILK